MKKYIYTAFMLAVALVTFTACSEDEGTEPGNDSKVNLVLNKYAAEAPYDADGDLFLRISTNSATQAAYLLVEKTADYTDRISKLGENGYDEYVVSNGSKVNGVNGAANVDTVVVGLKGNYTATVVAVGQGGMSSKTTTFQGVAWNDVAKGTYTFNATMTKLVGLKPVSTVLQVNADEPSSYRLKNVFGTKNIRIKSLGETGTDKNGKFTYVTVETLATPYTYGSYGNIYMADAYTYTGSASYKLNKLYEDGTLYILAYYYVSAGGLGNPDYDVFQPEK